MKPVLPSNKDILKHQLALACNALLEKKAEDLTLLYFGEKSSLTDCFIIATGTSDPHLKALRDNLEKILKKNDIETLSRDRFKARRMAGIGCDRFCRSFILRRAERKLCS